MLFPLKSIRLGTPGQVVVHGRRDDQRDVRLNKPASHQQTLTDRRAAIAFLLGCGFTAEIEDILGRFRGLLVVDEAYAPFAGENAARLREMDLSAVLKKSPLPASNLFSK